MGQQLTAQAARSHIKERIDADWAIIPWIVRHAGCKINYFRKDGSGITPWQHMKGRPFTKKLAIVGESVWYLMPSSLGSDKLDERCCSGIWYGIIEDSGEYMLGANYKDSDIQSEELR